MKNTDKNVVFAQNLKHASAFIKWYKLDVHLWKPNEYGGLLEENYENVILVRPFDGVTNEHFLWVSNVLCHKVKSIKNIRPIHWSYEELNK